MVPISAIEHHAYCPRQCALIHVEGQWADNRSTVDGVRAHRRTDSGRHKRERGRLVLRSIPLWSESLGLSGRADVVEVTDDGRVTPVEYKSGTRHGDAADLQVCAQAMCLEEMLGIAVPTAYVWFGAHRQRQLVRVDEGLRDATLATIGAIRRAISSGSLPAAVDDERCPPCQLRDSCLPEITGHSSATTVYVQRTVWGCDT